MAFEVYNSSYINAIEQCRYAECPKSCPIWGKMVQFEVDWEFVRIYCGFAREWGRNKAPLCFLGVSLRALQIFEIYIWYFRGVWLIMLSFLRKMRAWRWVNGVATERVIS